MDAARVMLSNLTAATVGYHAAVSPQLEAARSSPAPEVVSWIFLCVVLGLLTYFALKWHSEIKILRIRIEFRDRDIAFLKELLAAKMPVKTISADADSPSVRRCKAMIMMAAQSEGEEGRTAAMIACKFIRDEQLEIVSIDKPVKESA